MNLVQRKRIDYYLGGFLLLLLKPWVYLTGLLLRRDHALENPKNFCVIKMLGGGSLVIALPALLGIRRRYPDRPMTLVTSPSVAPFAESLGVFDRILIIHDSNFIRMIFSTFMSLIKTSGADQLIDLEVHSRLTSVYSALTLARNRVGFYNENVFWRRNLHTHLVYFNLFAGSYYFYEKVAELYGAEPASRQDCKKHLIRESGAGPRASNGSALHICIGHACSELGQERMLTADQWKAVLDRHRPSGGRKIEVKILGSKRDASKGDEIARALEGSEVSVENLCGTQTLPQSIETLSQSDEFWGIDSALLHYGRILGLKCVSYWGPTDPQTRLKYFEDLEEKIFYEKIPCSPCIHVTEKPPCRGDNRCIKGLFSERLETKKDSRPFTVSMPGERL